MNNQKPEEISYSNLLENLSSIAVKGTTPLFLVFVFSLVQLIKNGHKQNDYVLLLMGSILSFISVMGYVVGIVAFFPKKKGV